MATEIKYIHYNYYLLVSLRWKSQKLLFLLFFNSTAWTKEKRLYCWMVLKLSKIPTQSLCAMCYSGNFLAREFTLNLQFNFKAHYSQVTRGRKWYSWAHLLQYPRHFLFQTNDQIIYATILPLIKKILQHHLFFCLLLLRLNFLNQLCTKKIRSTKLTKLNFHLLI